MQKTRHIVALGIPLIAFISFTIAPIIISAWTGPTQPPPNGNVPAPINVGTVAQVKDGNIGINGLVVFGNSLFGGSTGSNAYLNFGPTSGLSGYGIRDKDGGMQFKNLYGTGGDNGWRSLQAIVFDLCSGGGCGGGGQWTTSSSNASLFYINTIGYVGTSGSIPVSPSETTDFSGYVNTKADGTGQTVSCPSATLVVGSSAAQCPPGQTFTNGCTSMCPAGYLYQNGSCIYGSCPVGYVQQGSACIFSGCPSGYVLQGNQCVAQTNQNQCTALPYCSGARLLDGCSDALIRTCDWGCNQGTCNPVPSPTATLTAIPLLVHQGLTSVISWTSTNVASCSVTSSNGDSWTDKTSTGKTSLPINGQTTYTLHCAGYAGAVPAAVDKSVTIGIIPSYQEI